MTGGSTGETYHFDYDTNGRLEVVGHRMLDSTLPGGAADTKRVRREYFASDGPFGTTDDVKAEFVELWQTNGDGGGKWVVQHARYLGYYPATGQVRFKFDQLQYNQLLERLGIHELNEARADQADVIATCAAETLTYFADGRVAEHAIDGGQRTYAFTTEYSCVTVAPNLWNIKTTETCTDALGRTLFTKTVYMNDRGDVLLTDLESDGGHWLEYKQYDDQYRLLLHVLPSALAGYSDLGGTLVPEYRETPGLFRCYEYGESTTAGPETPGDVEGLLKREWLKSRLFGGEEVAIRQRSYFAYSAGGQDVFPLASITEDPYSLDAATTSFAYTWHDGAVQVKRRATTLPLISAAKNGSGVAATRLEELDTWGRPVWTKDERGRVTHHVYDPATGFQTRTIEDVNTDSQAELDPPAGFEGNADGLHRVTDHEYDGAGRVVATFGPEHTAVVDGQPIAVRRATWTRYHEGATWRETLTAQGYQRVDDDTEHVVGPVAIEREQMRVEGRRTDSVQVAFSGTRAEFDTLGLAGVLRDRYARWTSSLADPFGRALWSRVYHDVPEQGDGVINVHYAQTGYGYDAAGRRNKTTAPGGTITCTVFDKLGRQRKTYVGTDDAGATDLDPTAGGANTMKIIAEQEYDGGSDGGSRLITTVWQYVDGDDRDANTRRTDYRYDWRDRRTHELPDGPRNYATYTCFHHDDRDRVVQVDRLYDHNGDLAAQWAEGTSSGDRLIARETTDYDARSRVWRTTTHAVDPDSGTVGDGLVGLSWCDAAGNPFKQVAPGARAFTKTGYDGLGRAAAVYMGYDLNETTADLYDEGGAARLHLDGSTIVEQSESLVDGAGNSIGTVSRQRRHDATGTGALTTPGGADPQARVTYAGSWFDPLGRQIAAAQLGTGPFDRTATENESVPARSDTVLVTETAYNARGETAETVAPTGRIDRQAFDDAGRSVKTIQNYVAPGACDPEHPDRNVTVEMAYNADGLLTELIAINPATGGDGRQVTRYVYGTAVGGAAPMIYRNDLLRAEIYPDSTNEAVGKCFEEGDSGLFDRTEYRYNRAWRGRPEGGSERDGPRVRDRTVPPVPATLGGSPAEVRCGRLSVDRVTLVGPGASTPTVRRIKTQHDLLGHVSQRGDELRRAGPVGTCTEPGGPRVHRLRPAGTRVSEAQQREGRRIPSTSNTTTPAPLRGCGPFRSVIPTAACSTIPTVQRQ